MSSPTSRAEVKHTTAGGLLKILRDPYSRLGPTVQGIEVERLANPTMLGVKRHG